MHHSDFKDLVAHFEDPTRAQWQKPDEVIASLGPLDGKTVADIGAGTGYFAFPIAKKAAKVMAIDIVLKSPLDEEWKYVGIYKFEGDILKLCMNKEKRPTTFENKDDDRLYVLQRPPKEKEKEKEK